EELQRDAAAEADMARLDDHAHAPLPEGAYNLVFPGDDRPRNGEIREGGALHEREAYPLGGAGERPRLFLVTRGDRLRRGYGGEAPIVDQGGAMCHRNMSSAPADLSPSLPAVSVSMK